MESFNKLFGIIIIISIAFGCSKKDDTEQADDTEQPEELIVGSWRATKDVVDCFPNSDGNEMIEILDSCQRQTRYIFTAPNGTSEGVFTEMTYRNFKGECILGSDSTQSYELSYDGEFLVMRFPPDQSTITIFKLNNNILQIGRVDGTCNGGNTGSHKYREFTRIE